MDDCELSAEDARWANVLVNALEEVQETSMEFPDARTQEILVRIAQCLIAAKVLLVAYRRSPSGNIEGEGGVAQQMHATQERVLDIMGQFGLSPDDFLDQDSTLRSLMLKSNVTSHIERLMRSEGSYCSFVAEE